MSLMRKIDALGGPGNMFVSIANWGDIIAHVRRLEPIVARTRIVQLVEIVSTAEGLEVHVDGQLKLTIL